MGLESIISFANLTSDQVIAIDSEGNVSILVKGQPVPPGFILVEKGEFVESPVDGTTQTPVVTAKYTTPNNANIDVTNEINDIITALEQGVDPTQLGEQFATAAGGGAGGSSLTPSATISRTDLEVLAQTSFDTSSLSGTGISQTQSLALVDVLATAVNADSENLTDDTSESGISAVVDADSDANTISESAANGTEVQITGLATDADATDTV
ncbi:hypothetical protein EES38_16215, partial [Vibrio viridaestus]